MSFPCRRSGGLVAESFGAELIVYDERTNDAHRLSEDAAAVWEACDGASSPDVIAEVSGVPLAQVAAAITELEGCDLLEAGAEGGGHWGPLLDRRGLLARAAVLSVPLITTVAIYPAVAHASTGSGTTFTLVKTLSGLGGPLFVAFSPDGKLLAVADYGGNEVVVYPVTLGSPDAVSSAPVATITATAPPSVAFSPDGTLLAVANQGPTEVDVYTVTLGASDTVATTAVAKLTGYVQPIAVAFSRDGKLLAGVDDGGHVYVYPITLGTGGGADAINPTPSATISGLNFPTSAAFSPDGKLLAVASPGGGTYEVTVYPVALGGGSAADTVSTTASATLTANQPQFVAFSPDGTLLAVANQNANDVLLYPVTLGGGASADSVGSGAATLSTGLSGPKAVAFSPDGTLLAVANYGDNNVLVFEATSGTPDTVGTTATTTLSGLSGAYDVAFNPDGSLLAVANHGNGTVSVYLRS